MWTIIEMLTIYLLPLEFKNVNEQEKAQLKKQHNEREAAIIVTGHTTSFSLCSHYLSCVLLIVFTLLVDCSQQSFNN